MTLKEFRNFCSSLPYAEANMPFGDTTLVFSVRGKMFTLVDIESFDFINVKCDPEEAIAIREKYDAVIPGYHMNKKHWNSILIESGTLDDQQIKQWIKNSYDLIIKSLPKKVREEL
jgi:predicted DNA-binding protein (MmcQ/YjbR family)